LFGGPDLLGGPGFFADSFDWAIQWGRRVIVSDDIPCPACKFFIAGGLPSARRWSWGRADTDADSSSDSMAPPARILKPLQHLIDNSSSG
jgi:hypothetical protein